MKCKDRFLVAFRNLGAGRQMAGKMIFGMMFVVMILFCFLIILQSFFAYTESFNQKHAADCYYFTELENLEINDTTAYNLQKQIQSAQEQYQASEVSVLCSLRPYSREGQLEAGYTGLGIDGDIHQATEYFLYQRELYQDIRGTFSPIALALYQNGMSVFADKIIAEYENDYLLGNYPAQPGEIMLDTYILEVYGIENIDEHLLGTTVSIYCIDEDTEEIVLRDYTLTGILQGDLLAVRESATASDIHLEHIYVNLKPEDETRFIISQGSIRYYFDDYLEYVKHYEYMDDILQLRISGDYLSDGTEAGLTTMGMEYCLLYWIMHHLGTLLLLVALAIGLIITCSVFYIFQFYRDRNARYFSMLRYIGMEKRDRLWIFSIEICSMLLAATILGIYLSALFLLLLNLITKQVLHFNIALDVKTSLATILISWLYFWICLLITVQKK